MNFEEDCKDLPAVGRRWVVVGLRRMRVAPAVVRIATGMAKQQQDKWLATYDATGDVQHEPTQGQRTDRAAVIAQSKETLKNLIDDGNRDARSSKRLATHLPIGPRQTRRLMQDPSVTSGYQRFQPAPLLTESAKRKRLAFAHKYRDQGWRKVAFTDSKIFPGEITAATARKMKAWMPNDGRRVAPTTKSCYQVHAYSAVTYFGAISIIAVTGTTGVESQFVYRTGKHRGQPNKGVCAEEYRTVFDTMHAELDALFRRNGVRDWVYQQDGATSHTAKATKEHILAKMGSAARFMDDWPPSSPDLSWIENIWAIVEHRLWAEYRWASLAEFKQALQDAWLAVTSENNGELMRKMSNGMRDRMLEVIAKEGATIDK